jgi:hypothetical protein
MKLRMASPERSRSISPPRDPGNPILCFGYGPIVHEMVRRRRNIRTTHVQAAFLDGYRLSFEFGGVANIVRQRGYRVHGVLMTLKSLRDWKKLQSFDVRRRVTQRPVFHYPKGGMTFDEDEEDEKEELVSELAYIIKFPEDVQDTFLCDDPAAERLPQEGYLKIIAEGMQQNGISYEYIEDEILNVPFIPDRSSENYFKFPLAHKVGRICYSTYQTVCERAKDEGCLYFVLGDSVFRLGEHDSNNPFAAWIEEHGHGKSDLTFFVQLILMEPSIPFCEGKAGVTPCHIAWAENQLVEYVQQYGLSATKVFQFCKDQEEEEYSSGMFTKRFSMPMISVVEAPPPPPLSSSVKSSKFSRKRLKVVSVFFKRMVHRNP